MSYNSETGIRSTDFHTTHYANNVQTIASTAKLENSTTLVYGTDTSSKSINTYLRGTNVTLQVKKGNSINYNVLQLTSDRINCNNYCNMKQGAEVSEGNFTVQNNTYLAQNAGTKVGIGTNNPLHKLYVWGNTFTKGFGIIPYYLSDSDLLPIISPGDGYAYRCLEIGKSAEVSCIIADRVALSGSIRGVLLNFKRGFDGQIVLLKDLDDYGRGNGYFWVTASGCTIIRPGISSKVSYDEISKAFDDGKSRFFVYSSKYNGWIVLYCG